MFVDEIFYKMNLGTKMTNSWTNDNEKENWEEIVHVHDIVGSQMSLYRTTNFLECLVNNL